MIKRIVLTIEPRFGDFVSVRGEDSDIPFLGYIKDGRQCTVPEDGFVELFWMYRQVSCITFDLYGHLSIQDSLSFRGT